MACALTPLSKLVTLRFVLNMRHDLLTGGHCVDTDNVGVTAQHKALGGEAQSVHHTVQGHAARLPKQAHIFLPLPQHR